MCIQYAGMHSSYRIKTTYDEIKEEISYQSIKFYVTKNNQNQAIYIRDILAVLFLINRIPVTENPKRCGGMSHGPGRANFRPIANV